MDVTTTITNYLGYSSTPSWSWYTRYGKSFIVKSESGYYFPCHYAFISGSNKPWLNFVKGLKYKNNQVGCTGVEVLTEEPNFSTEILQNYEVPYEPFSDWTEPQQIPV